MYGLVCISRPMGYKFKISVNIQRNQTTIGLLKEMCYGIGISHSSTEWNSRSTLQHYVFLTLLAVEVYAIAAIGQFQSGQILGHHAACRSV